MKKTVKKLSFIALAIIGLGLQTSFAQDALTDNHTVSITIPPVAILDLELSSSKNILGMDFIAPTEAGDPIVAPANNTALWLNYSSIVTNTGTFLRNISVKLGAALPGVDLKVTAGADAGAGAGTKGTFVAGGVTLTTTDQSLITGVGSCWTDTGVSKGHPLTYAVSLKSGDYGLLRSGTTVVTVTYTMSATL